MDTIKIVIADDHPIILDALKMLIESREEWHLAGEASDGIDLLRILKKQRPHIAIVDLEMPRMKGYETIAEIKRMYPEVNCIVLSGFVTEKNRQRAVSAGACAIISKGGSMQILMDAIERIGNGNPAAARHGGNPDSEDLNRAAGEALTLRERQILTLLAEGKTSRQISSLLNISQWTVNKHRSNIMEKLGFKNVIELVRYAIANDYAFLPKTD